MPSCARVARSALGASWSCKLWSAKEARKNVVEGSVECQKSIAEVQRAVNALSDAGAALSSGDLGQAQSAAGGGWVQDFQSAAASLDSTAKLSGEYETVVKGLGGIQNARDVDSARQSFVVAVTALQGWAADTGIASKLEGL